MRVCWDVCERRETERWMRESEEGRYAHAHTRTHALANSVTAQR